MKLETPKKKSFKKSKANISDLSGSQRNKLQELLALGIEACGPKSIIVGFNEVMKSVERNEVALIVSSSENNCSVTNCLQEVCKIRNIPCAFVENSITLISKFISIRRAVCFAIKKSENLTTDSDKLQHLKGLLDGLVELLSRDNTRV